MKSIIALKILEAFLNLSYDFSIFMKINNIEKMDTKFSILRLWCISLAPFLLNDFLPPTGAFHDPYGVWEPTKAPERFFITIWAKRRQFKLLDAPQKVQKKWKRSYFGKKFIVRSFWWRLFSFCMLFDHLWAPKHPSININQKQTVYEVHDCSEAFGAFLNLPHDFVSEKSTILRKWT